MKYKVGDRVEFYDVVTDKYGIGTIVYIYHNHYLLSCEGDFEGHSCEIISDIDKNLIIDKKMWFVNDNDIIKKLNNKEEIKEMEIKKNDNKIIDYKVIENKVVLVTFADGVTEKAICEDGTEFDFEMAVSVCIAKHIMGGSNAYNRIIAKGLKDIKNIDKTKKKEEERLAEENAIKDRHYEKMMKRKAKRTEKERQSRIDELSLAFLKAMKDYDNIGVNNNLEEFHEEMKKLAYMDKPECEFESDNETE